MEQIDLTHRESWNAHLLQPETDMESLSPHEKLCRELGPWRLCNQLSYELELIGRSDLAEQVAHIRDHVEP